MRRRVKSNQREDEKARMLKLAMMKQRGDRMNMFIGCFALTKVIRVVFIRKIDFQEKASRSMLKKEAKAYNIGIFLAVKRFMVLKDLGHIRTNPVGYVVL